MVPALIIGYCILPLGAFNSGNTLLGLALCVPIPIAMLVQRRRKRGDV